MFFLAIIIIDQQQCCLVWFHVYVKDTHRMYSAYHVTYTVYRISCSVDHITYNASTVYHISINAYLYVIRRKSICCNAYKGILLYMSVVHLFFSRGIFLIYCIGLFNLRKSNILCACVTESLLRTMVMRVTYSCFCF